MDTAGQKPNTLNPDLVRQALPPGGGGLSNLFFGPSIVSNSIM